MKVGERWLSFKSNPVLACSIRKYFVRILKDCEYKCLYPCSITLIAKNILKTNPLIACNLGEWDVQILKDCQYNSIRYFSITLITKIIFIFCYQFTHIVNYVKVGRLLLTEIAALFSLFLVL